MTNSHKIPLLVVLLLTVVGLLVIAPGNAGKVPDDQQRPGLVSTAVMFEQTSTHYPTGAEYAQAVYASQGIEISTDLERDSYVTSESPMLGDIVIGAGYVGILTGEGEAIGVASEGGPVQVMRLTNEEIRRVDW